MIRFLARLWAKLAYIWTLELELVRLQVDQSLPKEDLAQLMTTE